MNINTKVIKNALPEQDSATGRGLKTGVQAFLGVAFVFATGLIGVIKGVPGCSEAIGTFLQQNAIQYAALLGIPAGLVSFIWNILRKDVKNY